MVNSNVISFPTDMVRAEAKIDRAHKRWLEDQKAKWKDVTFDITILLEKSNRQVKCSYVNREVYIPELDAVEYYPAMHNQSEGLFS